MHSSDDLSYESAPVCGEGSSIIYAWARDAPALTLPEGVGFKVGGDTKVQYVVLQVHYMHPMPKERMFIVIVCNL
jgi:peptidylglycine monooxygenase